MQHQFSVLLVLIVLSVNAYAQEKQRVFDGTDTVRVKLSVGQSSDNTYTQGKEAEIIGTFPDSTGAQKSWMTNAYAEFGLTSDESRWSFGLVGELHRNTLIAKKQDVRQYGISLGKIFQIAGSISPLAEIPVNLTIKNSDDKVEKKETFQVIGGTTFNRFVGRGFLKTQTAFPADSTPFGKAIQFSHNHNLGIAYLGKDEDVLLGQLDFELNIYLFTSLSKKWMDKLDLFKLQASYKGRTKLLGKTDLELNSLVDLQAGLNLSFGAEKKNSVGVAYDWIQGADPLKGLKDQKYETFTAKVKFAIGAD